MTLLMYVSCDLPTVKEASRNMFNVMKNFICYDGLQNMRYKDKNMRK